MSDQSSSELPPGLRMYQLIFGYFVTPSIYAATKLGIADLVAEEPRTVDQ
jgi:hypothetical protein